MPKDAANAKWQKEQRELRKRAVAEHIREWNAVHRFSPDGWLVIPNFDIRPADVNFVGFDQPVLIPANPSAAASVRGMLSSARRLLRTEVASISEFWAEHLIALEALSLDPEADLSSKQRAALVYEAVLHAFGEMRGWSEDRAAVRTTELAFAGEILTQWALDGVALAEMRAKERRKEQPRHASKQPRPRARSPLKMRVQEMMKPYKRDRTSFKVFLQAWIEAEDGTLDDLTITEIEVGALYEVSDDRADGNPVPYTFTTLQTMYTNAIQR